MRSGLSNNPVSKRLPLEDLEQFFRLEGRKRVSHTVGRLQTGQALSRNFFPYVS
jgi:hypothetical protein